MENTPATPEISTGTPATPDRPTKNFIDLTRDSPYNSPYKQPLRTREKELSPPPCAFDGTMEVSTFVSYFPRPTEPFTQSPHPCFAEGLPEDEDGEINYLDTMISWLMPSPDLPDKYALRCNLFLPSGNIPFTMPSINGVACTKEVTLMFCELAAIVSTQYLHILEIFEIPLVEVNDLISTRCIPRPEYYRITNPHHYLHWLPCYTRFSAKRTFVITMVNLGIDYRPRYIPDQLRYIWNVWIPSLYAQNIIKHWDDNDPAKRATVCDPPNNHSVFIGFVPDNDNSTFDPLSPENDILTFDVYKCFVHNQVLAKVAAAADLMGNEDSRICFESITLGVTVDPLTGIQNYFTKRSPSIAA
jgi:hypothetical protein